MKNTLLAIWNFYLEGFRSMTLGRTLWLIILVKLFIMFFILKIFFFPDFLGDHPTDADKGTYVGNELIQNRAKNGYFIGRGWGPSLFPKTVWRQK